MLTFVLILGGSLVVGFAVYGILSQTGLLPSTSDQPRSSSPSLLADGRVPHLRELPQGCLIGIILAALVWFTLWGVVLFLALRFLRSPFAT